MALQMNILKKNRTGTKESNKYGKSKNLVKNQSRKEWEKNFAVEHNYP